MFGAVSAVDLIRKYENVVIARTFSKGFGVPSIRLGYLISNKDNMNVLSKTRFAHESNSLSNAVAEHLLDNYSMVEQYNTGHGVAREDERACWRSWACRRTARTGNFLLLDLGITPRAPKRTSRAARAEDLHQGSVVRAVRSLRDHHARPDRIMERFVDATRYFCEGARGMKKVLSHRRFRLRRLAPRRAICAPAGLEVLVLEHPRRRAAERIIADVQVLRADITDEGVASRRRRSRAWTPCCTWPRSPPVRARSRSPVLDVKLNMLGTSTPSTGALRTRSIAWCSRPRSSSTATIRIAKRWTRPPVPAEVRLRGFEARLRAPADELRAAERHSLECAAHVQRLRSRAGHHQARPRRGRHIHEHAAAQTRCR